MAFSKLSQADNVGYIIPWKIVAHFLREYEDHGVFRGCCSVGFRWQDMENTHMREHYKACLFRPRFRACNPPCKAQLLVVVNTTTSQLLFALPCQLHF